VPPIYRDAATGRVYPVFLRRLRHACSRACCARPHSSSPACRLRAGFESYRAVGPRRFGRRSVRAPTALADIETSYQLLLLVSPVNIGEAWAASATAVQGEPQFRYRLLPVDPDCAEAALFDVDLEPVADPAMAFLLRDKRDELDRQITLIAERNTDGFRYASMRLYGAVDDMLLNVARDVLTTVQPAGRRANASAYPPRNSLRRPRRTRVLPRVVSRSGSGCAGPPRPRRTHGLAGRPADRRKRSRSGRSAPCRFCTTRSARTC
jgi:hypothetical protein